MEDFDAILGMDWMEKLGAIIDCPSQSIKFLRNGKRTVMSVGERHGLPSYLLSTLLANRLLNKGFIAFIAHIMVIKKSEPDISTILVVNEFPYVFPDELPGFLPDREFHFAIDVHLAQIQFRCHLIEWVQMKW